MIESEIIQSTEANPSQKSTMFIGIESRIGTVEVQVGQSDETDVSMEVSMTDLGTGEKATAKELTRFYSTAQQMASAAIEVALLRQHPDAVIRVVASEPAKKYKTVAKMDPDTRKIIVSERAAAG